MNKKIIVSIVLISIQVAFTCSAKKLDQIKKQFEMRGWDTPVSYIEAEHWVTMSTTWNEKANDTEKAQIAELCSLKVEAVEVTMKSKMVEEELSDIRMKKDSILTTLSTTYREINQLERGYALKLKSNLDQVRQRARERQEEAQKKFESLQSDLINVKRDARGIILSMSDILFGINEDKVKSKLKTNLAKIAGILSVYKEAKVTVEGHTDNVGKDEYNQSLSERRAKNVMAFLIEQGITEDRLTAIGLGETMPISDNSTKKGRQQNRRVDLIIADKKQKEEAN